eukprot:12747920-Ditylum_brightwellii.AAC.1
METRTNHNDTQEARREEYHLLQELVERADSLVHIALSLDEGGEECGVKLVGMYTEASQYYFNAIQMSIRLWKDDDDEVLVFHV